jgi:hypothetical protein
LFCGSKNFLKYFINEGRPIGIFSNDLGHLWWVTRLACSSQSQFIPIRTLFTSSTIQVYLITCTLFEGPNIIIRSCNEKALGAFPRLLQPNIMDCFKKVTSWHVDELL